MPFGQFSHAGSHGFQQSVFDPKGSLTLQFTIPHGDHSRISQTMQDTNRLDAPTPSLSRVSEIPRKAEADPYQVTCKISQAGLGTRRITHSRTLWQREIKPKLRKYQDAGLATA
ncbi:hypothetical protein VTN96DRAFT_3837 [Rasamsonia emersonii]